MRGAGRIHYILTLKLVVHQVTKSVNGTPVKVRKKVMGLSCNTYITDE